METEFEISKAAIVTKGIEVAEACSAFIGPPRWPNDWDCPGNYYAEIFKFDTFGFIIEDIEDVERDSQGMTTLTDRRIKAFDQHNKLLMDASCIVQGVDKQFAKNDEEDRIEEIEDSWKVHRVAHHLENIDQIFQKLIDTLEKETI